MNFRPGPVSQRQMTINGLTSGTLSRARAGDETAFRELTDPYRRELQLHCYRILGSVQDAEDLLQETLLAAWRGLDQFEGRSSLRAWLYRIARRSPSPSRPPASYLANQAWTVCRETPHCPATSVTDRPSLITANTA